MNTRHMIVSKIKKFQQLKSPQFVNSSNLKSPERIEGFLLLDDALHAYSLTH
jgi:hypothetical protein